MALTVFVAMPQLKLAAERSSDERPERAVSTRGDDALLLHRTYVTSFKVLKKKKKQSRLTDGF
jgi:hypothetical protein